MINKIIEQKIEQYQAELERVSAEIERLQQIRLRIEGGIIAAREILDELEKQKEPSDSEDSANS